jgi:hypothetical protein
MGMKLWRAESLNDSPVLTRALVQVVESSEVPAEEIQQTRTT